MLGLRAHPAAAVLVDDDDAEGEAAERATVLHEEAVAVRDEHLLVRRNDPRREPRTLGRDAARAAGYRLVFGSCPGINRGLGDTTLVRRVAITRGLGAQGFDQVLAWQGATVRRLRLRHRLLSVPKHLLGDERYDRLREALVR